jgi:predicted Zn-dependent peptidase
MSVTWEISQLDNGMRVVTTPVPTAQSVSVNVFVGAGSRGEQAESKGLAHFLEHMVFKGTEKRPTAIAIAEAIEGAGGVLNAYTSKELTCYWNQVPFDRLELAVDVLLDMLTASVLDQEELDRERSVVQQEIRRGKDQPAAWCGELLGEAMYGDQPMGWSTAGTEETVGALPRDAFIGWLDTWYGPGNMIVSVAGNTSHGEVVAAVRSRLSDGASAAAPSVTPVNGTLPARRVISDSRDISQANLALSMPAFARDDPDRYILQVLNAILGRGMSSRLFKEVRERRGLAYSVSSSVSRYKDTGAFTVMAGVSPEKLDEAVTVILQELAKPPAEPVPGDELTKARDYTVGSFRLSLETPMALAQRAGEQLLTLGEIEPVDTVVERIQSVSADDVMRVAQRVLSPEKTALAVVGPGLDDERLLGLLAA